MPSDRPTPTDPAGTSATRTIRTTRTTDRPIPTTEEPS